MKYPTEGLSPTEKRCLGLALSTVRGTGGFPEAEDLRSAIVYEVLHSLKEAAPSGADPEKVACRAARSAVADYWKYHNRKKRQAEVVPLALLTEAEEPYQSDFAPALVEWLDAQERIRRTCSPFEARCLLRFYLRQETYQEIAASEGVPRKRVDNVICNALRKLRRTV